MRLAYLHVLPLEYYPPATNFLDIISRYKNAEVSAFTTINRYGRPSYQNEQVEFIRTRAPNPESGSLLRLAVACWWHVKTAYCLWKLKPDAVMYIEPHSAIAVWLYYCFFRGNARLLVHHHEYYEAGDFLRPGIRLPRLGHYLELRDLFRRAEWVSQTNEQRLQFAKADAPALSTDPWQVLPNYPPASWPDGKHEIKRSVSDSSPKSLVYIGAASFSDTYILELVLWVASHPKDLILKIYGYNVANDVKEWIEVENFSNLQIDNSGYEYNMLPSILAKFDVGLVLYKGKTTNFVFNTPNKVFEYLRCGLEVWYPEEMTGLSHFAEQANAPLTRLSFKNLEAMDPAHISPAFSEDYDASRFTAEKAFAPLLLKLGLDSRDVMK